MPLLPPSQEFLRSDREEGVRSTLDELKRELDELRSFVASITHMSEVVAMHAEPAIRQFIALRRRFDNAAFVVALYASFESYVEKLAAALASLEAQRLPYAELPQKLVNKHLQRSADLLARGRLGEGRHAGLTHAGVVSNLYNCLNGSTPYALNAAAVVWHDSNLRTKDVDDIFLPLGIESICSQVRHGDALIQWHMEIQGLPAVPADGVPRTVIDERLNDLIERRNRVAHRGGNPEDLFGAADMDEAIGFVYALSTDIFSMVVGYYLQTRHGLDSAATRLKQMAGDGPYKNGQIVVVSPPDIPLSVGLPIFVNKASGAARWGRIQSLRLNDADHETIATGTSAPQGIGVRLDFSCSASDSLVVLPGEDDLVWAPI